MRNIYCTSIVKNKRYHSVSQRYHFTFIFMFFRHMLGEDLEPLNLKELQNLEKQLDKTLSRARQRKVCTYKLGVRISAKAQMKRLCTKIFTFTLSQPTGVH